VKYDPCIPLLESILREHEDALNSLLYERTQMRKQLYEMTLRIKTERSEVSVKRTELRRRRIEALGEPVHAPLRADYSVRNIDIFTRVIGGETLSVVGKRYSLSTERCRQIISKLMRRINLVASANDECFDWELSSMRNNRVKILRYVAGLSQPPATGESPPAST
jgi:hypothetical protein